MSAPTLELRPYQSLPIETLRNAMRRHRRVCFQLPTGGGKTIEGERMRLFGIDAFELEQACLDGGGQPWRCGADAQAALAELIQDQAVSCTVLEENQAQGYVAQCHVRDEVDLGGYMVEAGLALAAPEQTDTYDPQQTAARAARKGAWAGTFTPPWDWRDGQPDE